MFHHNEPTIVSSSSGATTTTTTPAGGGGGGGKTNFSFSGFSQGTGGGGNGSGSLLDVHHSFGNEGNKCVAFCSLGGGAGRKKKAKRGSGSSSSIRSGGGMMMAAMLSKKSGNSNNKNGTVLKEGVSESVLAKELTELSISERNLALSDIHGVSDVIDETPMMLSQAFQDLDIELSKIKKCPAYDRAVFFCPRYVNSRDFKVKFLRADRFDPKAAAQRIVNHFELKLKLFGYDKLARDITFEDLSEQGRADVLCGGVWVLNKGYDQAGRKIIMVCLEHVNLQSDNVSKFS